MSPRLPSARPNHLAILALLVAVSAGCHSDKDAEATAAQKDGSQTLRPSDFSTKGRTVQAEPAPEPAAPASNSRKKGTQPPSSAPATAAASEPASPPAASASTPKTLLPETVELNAPSTPPTPSTLAHDATDPAAGDVNVSGKAGPPPMPDPSAHAVDRPLVIDSLVGQINGKPVFASEILEPLDGKLRAMSTQTKSRREWLTAANAEISKELRRRIEDELFVSEARASLTPEQRTGLFQFLSQIQESLVSSAHGSQVAADEALQREGKSLQGAAKDRLDRELIANEVRNRVLPRVAVPWRDVQQEYEREYEKFNPPPIAHLRMIVVKSNDADGIAGITAELGSGAPFEAVASRPPNEFARAEGGKLDREFTGDFETATLSKVQEVNEAARGLSPGQTAGPIAYTDDASRARTAWIHLDDIEHRPGKSLFDVQLEIENALKATRFEAEMTKYLEGLKRRGNVSKIEDMNEQLLKVAEERYLPAGRK